MTKALLNHLHVFLLLLFLVRWFHGERHLQPFLRTVKHDFIRELHGATDLGPPAEESATTFSITAVRACNKKSSQAFNSSFCIYSFCISIDHKMKSVTQSHSVWHIYIGKSL